eukprot:TRINITY_DN13841_c0_g1_i1.p1 TRINITY_DN13841_c0_g1~~TRINITY_DN13841_c0_g1_i1.p1  ORF type:complete len:363 (-),score=70.48 TRINITY_DN13841_c0_g1_i1:238-1278(-)
MPDMFSNAPGVGCRLKRCTEEESEMRTSDASTGDPSISCDSSGTLSDETSANEAELRSAQKQIHSDWLHATVPHCEDDRPKQVLHAFVELMNRKERAKPNVERVASPRLVARDCNVDSTHSTAPHAEGEFGRLKAEVILKWKEHEVALDVAKMDCERRCERLKEHVDNFMAESELKWVSFKASLLEDCKSAHDAGTAGWEAEANRLERQIKEVIRDGNDFNQEQRALGSNLQALKDQRTILTCDVDRREFEALRLQNQVLQAELDNAKRDVATVSEQQNALEERFRSLQGTREQRKREKERRKALDAMKIVEPSPTQTSSWDSMCFLLKCCSASESSRQLPEVVSR